jgi:hypothetical protein
MGTKTIEVDPAQVSAMRSVIRAIDDGSDELDDELSKSEGNVELELDNKHHVILTTFVEAYREIHTEELPDDTEYYADFGVLDDIKAKISDN